MAPASEDVEMDGKFAIQDKQRNGAQPGYACQAGNQTGVMS
jgi:hypothetical protein